MTTLVEAQAIVKKASSSRRKPGTSGNHASVRRGLHLANGRRSLSASPAVDFEIDLRTPRELTERHLASVGRIPVSKRLLDVVCILISLPVTLPTMAVVALWIKLVSHGPALFRQERIGRNGRSFTLYKFRSMKMNAATDRHKSHFSQLVRSNSPMVKLDLLCDSRLIPGGCFLRSAGLDELPQLFNVLRGEMSLVGPRPCLPEEFRFFSPKHRERFEVLPGLTGIWQVIGKGLSTFSEMNAMDALYVRRSSLMLDLAIMFRTPLALLRQTYQALRHYRADKRKSDLEMSEEPSFSGYSTHRLG